MIKPRLMSNGGDEARTACGNLVNVFEGALRLLHPLMPFITEEIWHAIYDGKPPLRSVALASYPQVDEEQIDLAAETEMAVLQDLIVSVRQLRLDLKVEARVKIAIELFVHDPGTGISIIQNQEAIKRLGNVESITNVEEWRARQSPSRGTARFDVHVVYERKIDLALERERFTKELGKIQQETATNRKQLRNDQ